MIIMIIVRWRTGGMSGVQRITVYIQTMISLNIDINLWKYFLKLIELNWIKSSELCYLLKCKIIFEDSRVLSADLPVITTGVG